MPTIYVDNQAYEVAPDQNLLAACLTLGFDLPFFCWHPAMGSVGACRQCAVKQFKDETDTKGQIVMACLTPADDGVRISIEDPEAKAFRKGVAEWLMASHPHDCPVCDEGGECHLQDMTVMTGHVYRRYDFPKRTFRNQDLGPFVNHEMNRCIQCYRCVRFYEDYAGGHDLVALGTRNEVYFGRHEDGKLESEFSGNLVEVCPTGVFTDKTFKTHYTRKWDLQTAPSVCVHCGLGCNTIPGERYGILRRVRSRYNGHVNGYFICDRGRFGYEFVNAESRPRSVTVAKQAGPALASTHTAAPWPATGSARTAAPPPAIGGSQTVSPEEAVSHVADLIRSAVQSGGRVVGIGSPRASLEANFALRALVGPDNFFCGMSDQEARLVRLMVDILRTGPSRSSSLRELERADATLILGEDVTNTAPMLDYSLRQWLRRRPNLERTRLKIPDWNDAAVGEIVHEEPSALYVATRSGDQARRVRSPGLSCRSQRSRPVGLCHRPPARRRRSERPRSARRHLRSGADHRSGPRAGQAAHRRSRRQLRERGDAESGGKCRVVFARTGRGCRALLRGARVQQHGFGDDGREAAERGLPGRRQPRRRAGHRARERSLSACRRSRGGEVPGTLRVIWWWSIIPTLV